MYANYLVLPLVKPKCNFLIQLLSNMKTPNTRCITVYNSPIYYYMSRITLNKLYLKDYRRNPSQWSNNQEIGV